MKIFRWIDWPSRNQVWDMMLSFPSHVVANNTRRRGGEYSDVCIQMTRKSITAFREKQLFCQLFRRLYVRPSISSFFVKFLKWSIYFLFSSSSSSSSSRVFTLAAGPPLDLTHTVVVFLLDKRKRICLFYLQFWNCCSASTVCIWSVVAVQCMYAAVIAQIVVSYRRRRRRCRIGQLSTTNSILAHSDS